MRCWQPQGLTPAGKNFIKGNAAVTSSITCPTCGHTEHGGPVSVVYQETDSWYGEGYRLRRFTRPIDGRQFEEYIQVEPWSSGPCTFLALRWTDTQEPISETLWDEDSITYV